jgi:hypothetical protein
MKSPVLYVALSYRGKRADCAGKLVRTGSGDGLVSVAAGGSP